MRGPGAAPTELQHCISRKNDYNRFRTTYHTWQIISHFAFTPKAYTGIARQNGRQLSH